MAIEKRWINWATAVSAAVLLVFTLAQLVVCFYTNLAAQQNQTEKTNISGATLVSLGVLFFPTVWVAFMATMSRHRGVYIAVMVLASLSLLDAIGMLAYQVYGFSVTTASYQDTEKGLTITMTVLQSVLIVAVIFVMAFAGAALCYRCPEHDRHNHEKYRYPAGYGQPPPIYNGAPAVYQPSMEGYRMSMPRGAWDYATEPRYLKARY